MNQRQEQELKSRVAYHYAISDELLEVTETVMGRISVTRPATLEEAGKVAEMCAIFDGNGVLHPGSAEYLVERLRISMARVDIETGELEFKEMTYYPIIKVGI